MVCAARNGEQESNVVIFPVGPDWVLSPDFCIIQPVLHPTHFDTKDGGSVFPPDYHIHVQDYTMYKPEECQSA